MKYGGHRGFSLGTLSTKNLKQDNPATVLKSEQLKSMASPLFHKKITGYGEAKSFGAPYIFFIYFRPFRASPKNFLSASDGGREILISDKFTFQHSQIST